MTNTLKIGTILLLKENYNSISEVIIENEHIFSSILKDFEKQKAQDETGNLWRWTTNRHTEYGRLTLYTKLAPLIASGFAYNFQLLGFNKLKVTGKSKFVS